MHAMCSDSCHYFNFEAFFPKVSGSTRFLVTISTIYAIDLTNSDDKGVRGRERNAGRDILRASDIGRK